MAMSKQNYEHIADILAISVQEPNSPDADFMFELARNLANYFQGDNPNFNRELFLKAAGVI